MVSKEYIEGKLWVYFGKQYKIEEIEELKWKHNYIIKLKAKNGTLYILKIRPLIDKELKAEKLNNEISNVFERLKNNPPYHLCRVIDYKIDDNNLLWLLMDYIDGKELKHYHKSITHENEESFINFLKTKSKRDIIEIVKQILKALKDLHKMGLLYQDLKVEQIIIDEGNNNAYLIDPDSIILKGGLCAKEGGTWHSESNYNPDETEYTELTDIFAAGTVFYELATGKQPRPEYYPIDTVGIEGEIRKIIDRMVASSPLKRYQTIEDIINDLQSLEGVITDLDGPFKYPSVYKPSYHEIPEPITPPTPAPSIPLSSNVGLIRYFDANEEIAIKLKLTMSY